MKGENHWKVLNCVVYDLHFIDIMLDVLWGTDFRNTNEKWEVSGGLGGSRSKVIAYKPRKEIVSKTKERSTLSYASDG